MEQSYNWMFTLNNPQADENPKDWKYKYLVYQLEKGDSGTLHFQGYVHFEKRQTLAALKKLSSRAHWEPRKGSHVQARVYCTKPETRVDGPWEFGDPPQQGCRNDLHSAAELVLRKRPFSEIEPATYVKYHKGLAALRSVHTLPRNWKPLVISLTGPTGCGKTRAAFEKYPEAYFKDSTQWWDGYSGQEVVIIDEFYGQIPFAEMLKILDRYPHQVQTKGGYVQLTCKTIIITSNTKATDWYKINHDWKPPLFRRIDRFYEYQGEWVLIPDMLNGPGEWISITPPIDLSHPMPKQGSTSEQHNTDN